MKVPCDKSLCHQTRSSSVSPEYSLLQKPSYAWQLDSIAYIYIQLGDAVHEVQKMDVPHLIIHDLRMSAQKTDLTIQHKRLSQTKYSFVSPQHTFAFQYPQFVPGDMYLHTNISGKGQPLSHLS